MQKRAEATRLKLLDTTVSTLVDCGYSGTTTAEVCRRASVSRGTLLYHFPTRESLLVAALHHVLSDRVADFVASRQSEEPGSVEDFVAQMWAAWQGPALVAWLELAVAARTNEGLRAPMQETMLAFDQLVLDAFRTLKPIGELPADYEEVAPFFVFALLNGLAVGRSYEPPGHSDPVLKMLVNLAEAL